MTERQRERKRDASNMSNKGRVREGERKNDREATRERHTYANTSNKERVRGEKERE